MSAPPKPRPMSPALRDVLARLAVRVARPQHREACARAERQRRRDVAALLESRGK